MKRHYLKMQAIGCLTLPNLRLFCSYVLDNSRKRFLIWQYGVVFDCFCFYVRLCDWLLSSRLFLQAIAKKIQNL